MNNSVSKNIRLIAVFSLPLCAIIYWLSNTYSTYSSNTLVHCKATQDPQDTSINDNSDTQLQLLHAENSALKKQLAELKKTLDEAQVSMAAKSPTAFEEPTDLPASAINEQYQNLKRANDFSSYQSELAAKNISMEKDLENKFNAEAVDYEWAADYQEKISTLFANTNTLQEITPELIECKTHKCQIKIRITDNTQANHFTNAFSTAIDANTLNIQKTDVIAAPDFSQGFLNLYIAKNNHIKIYE